MIVADRNNHRVRRVGRDGTVTTLAGDGNAGQTFDQGVTYEGQPFIEGRFLFLIVMENFKMSYHVFAALQSMVDRRLNHSSGGSYA